MDKNELKSSLTLQDIEQVLKYFNVDYYYNTQDDIQMSTVCHGGDSHKLYYYPESESFRCYTDCSESFDIYDFIVKVSKTRGEVVNFHEAYQLAGTIVGVNVYKPIKRKIGFHDETSQVISDWGWIGNLKRRKKFEPKLEPISEDILNSTDFKDWKPLEWLKEGISMETMHKYGIKFLPERNSTIIPHYNIDSELIGIRVRNWRGVGESEGERSAIPKYSPLYYKGEGFNHPLGYNLYSVDKNKENIKKSRKAMLVESEKSCLKADTFFSEDSFVVGMCGSSLNSYQADILLELGIEKIIISVDKDYHKQPDEAYKRKIMNIAKHFVNKVEVTVLMDTRGVMDYQECVMDRNKEELLNIMEYDQYDIGLLDNLI